MILCNFSDNGFSVSGHSGYSDSGSDIVCAAVSAMVMLVCNTITEKFSENANVSVDENNGSVTLIFDKQQPSKQTKLIIEALKDELIILSKEYPDNLTVI